MLTLRTPPSALRRLELPITPLPHFKALLKAGRRNPWFSWSGDKRPNIGCFTLNGMKLTGPYEHAVARFLAAVKNAGIRRVAVDLRKKRRRRFPGRSAVHAASRRDNTPALFHPNLSAKHCPLHTGQPRRTSTLPLLRRPDRPRILSAHIMRIRRMRRPRK